MIYTMAMANTIFDKLLHHSKLFFNLTLTVDKLFEKTIKSFF